MAASVLTLALLGVVGLISTQAPQDHDARYWALVEQYLRGDRARALADIASWEVKDLEKVASSVSHLSESANRCAACPDRKKFDALPVRAAVLLLAERDRLDRMNARLANQGGECSASHNATIERLLRLVRRQPGGTEFSSRFSVAMSLHYRSLLCFLHARATVESGLKADPHDAVLHLAGGLVDESIGVLGFAGPPASTDADQRSAPIDHSDATARKSRLSQARVWFEKALAANANLHEARLRLGRVYWRLGKLAEALVSLKRSAAECGPPLSFLAHLFLGRVFEDSNEIDAAIQEYRRAMALNPRIQVGVLALSHALVLRGDVEPARALLETTLTSTRPRPSVDAYATYLAGTPAVAEEFFSRLRLELTK